MMTLDAYQKSALTTSLVNDSPEALHYLALGLCSEAGEVAGLVKKNIRDHNGDSDALPRVELLKELGDVLWYVAILAQYLDFPLQLVAGKNLEKLADRASREVLTGSGDDR